MTQKIEHFGAKEWIIAINVLVFIVIGIIHTLGNTFLTNGTLSFEVSLEFSPINILHKPWSVFTYMWIHYNVLHLISNMVIFYFFARLFKERFTDKDLIIVFSLAGIISVLGYYLIVFLISLLYSKLGYIFIDKSIIGASSGVIAIVFSSVFIDKDKRIPLYKGISVKVKYLAIAIFLLFTIANITNFGGHIVHLIGAVFGILFANKKKIELEEKANQEKQQRQISNKIKSSGYNSLNDEEKKILIEQSKRQRTVNKV